MTIKHLVISGGGPIMVQILGAIQQLENNKFINIADIESIYGTSAGAIVGALICLKFDWETIYDYIIKRPWQNVFTIKVENILEAYSKKGLFDIRTIEKCFKPLLDERDIPININLEEFYNKTKIELHLYAFDINEYKVEDISYITHPKLNLLTALQMSCGIPVLMKPICAGDKCFIDGGISCNYPLNYAIKSGKLADEILGFKNKYKNNKNYVTEESSLLDFLLNFLFKAIFSLNTDDKQPTIENEIICEADYLSLEILNDVLSSSEIRKKMWGDGMTASTKFLENLKYILQTREEMPP